MSETETPYLDGGAAWAPDLGEPWRLSGPESRIVLNKRGQTLFEIRHCGVVLRHRIVECCNAAAGVAGPGAFVYDCLAALRPFAEFWQRNPQLHAALDANPRAATTIGKMPLRFFERALATLVAGGRGRAGITEEVSQALWQALVALGEPVPAEVAMHQAVATLRRGLERIAGLEGDQQ